MEITEQSEDRLSVYRHLNCQHRDARALGGNLSARFLFDHLGNGMVRVRDVDPVYTHQVFYQKTVPASDLVGALQSVVELMDDRDAKRYESEGVRSGIYYATVESEPTLKVGSTGLQFFASGDYCERSQRVAHEMIRTFESWAQDGS